MATLQIWDALRCHAGCMQFLVLAYHWAWLFDGITLSLFSRSKLLSLPPDWPPFRVPERSASELLIPFRAPVRALSCPCRTLLATMSQSCLRLQGQEKNP